MSESLSAKKEAMKSNCHDKRKRIGRKHLSIDLPEWVYILLKERAVIHNCTMTKLVTRSIVMLLKAEIK